MYSSEDLEKVLLSVPDRGFASWEISPIVLCQEQSPL